jgi:gamma-glutamyl hercynylcysteine S-oxide synthase
MSPFDRVLPYVPSASSAAAAMPSSAQLLDQLATCDALTRACVQPLLSGDLSGWERAPDSPHPILWELGHIAFFYESLFLQHGVDPSFTKSHAWITEADRRTFDNMQTSPDQRIALRLHELPPIRMQLGYYNHVMDALRKWVHDTRDPSPDSLAQAYYVLHACTLHHHMHIEVLLLLLQLIGTVPNPLPPVPSATATATTTATAAATATTQNPFVSIPAGTFRQGLDPGDRCVVWDNEAPAFTAQVEAFEAQTYPVTQQEYLAFVEANGYRQQDLWSREGWQWVQQTKAWHPLYWSKRNGQWFRRHFDTWKPLKEEGDCPVVHVNYYEAEAYAAFRHARLPTETEMEYLLSTWPRDAPCNMGYLHGDVVSVHAYPKNKNAHGVHGLMGDVWAWTSTPFRPYDGFKVDPVYDTFSYPFFHTRTVVKGGCWAAPHILAHPQYRNAQEKHKRFHFTGIRLVRRHTPISAGAAPAARHAPQ